MAAVSCGKNTKQWHQRPLVLVCIVATLSIPLVSVGLHDMSLMLAYQTYLGMMWWAFLLGTLIAGIIDTYVPNTYIEALLAQQKKRTLLTATLIGCLLSTCSHGVLVIAMNLYKKGASVAAVIVLLTAAPWTSIPTSLLLWRFFGYQGFVLIGIALAISLLTGLFFQHLERKQHLDPRAIAPTTPPTSFAILADIKTRYQHYTYTPTQLLQDIRHILNHAKASAGMLGWWLGIALVLASYIQTFTPQYLFQTLLVNTPSGLLGTLGLATLIEVCSEGSSVLAFELYSQTQSLGHVLVFLLAGVATDYTEIGLIWNHIGKRTACLLPLVSIPLILIAGICLL